MRKFLLSSISVIFLVLINSNLFGINPVSIGGKSIVYSQSDKELLIEQNQRSHRIVNWIKGLASHISGKLKAVYLKKVAIFKDPTKKWMAFWLLFGLLAIILLGISIVIRSGGDAKVFFLLFWYLGWAASAFSSISFVIWIIKLIQGA